MSTSVDAILKYKRKEDEDFYGMLGCDELASAEQITAEYKVLALQCHPDKNPDDPNAEARFQLMKEAKETLCDPARRANYDKWRNSGISIGYRQWLGMKEHVHQSMHWSTMKTKDRMLAEGATSQGPPSTSLGAPAGAQRRASEGGANIHYGGRNPAQWSSDPPSEVVAKFRNYEI